MHGAIISIDVSKGKSHYQGFIEADKTFTKPRVFTHTKKKFDDLLEYKKSLEKNVSDGVSVVFEATGVYHRPIQKFLEDHNIRYYIISPLLSAKMRQSELHANKTDSLGCGNIAKVYYSKKLREYRIEKDIYYELREMSRYYEDTLDHMRKYKVTFTTKLEVVFPGYDKLFKAKYSDNNTKKVSTSRYD